LSVSRQTCPTRSATRGNAWRAPWPPRLGIVSLSSARRRVTWRVSLPSEVRRADERATDLAPNTNRWASLVDLNAAFETQAARVGALVHRAPPNGAVEAGLGILKTASCRSVALADVLREKSAFVHALVQAGLSEVATQVLWPTRRADAGISLARLGVAETGSVLLHSSSPDRRVELCVDVHLVVLDSSALVPTLDQAFSTLREISAAPPAYATLVSGPSRSADIERTLTVGIHGPRELHILLLGPEI
jgi:L-lactate dehydrogenase complex protein LldG